MLLREEMWFVGKTREEMENFWKEHSANATEEEMMLDSNAEQLGREEVPEILSLLPNAARLDVLELGAGIGSVLDSTPHL